MSDFGDSDYYVAAVKAKILKEAPSTTIIDITHRIEHFNIAHGSYVLKSVFRDFPEGTVHISAISSHGNEQQAHIALKLEGHYFVGSDNGLFSLISEQEPDAIIKIANNQEEKLSFPAKNIFANVAAQLANGKDINSLGEEYPSYKRLLSRQVRATKKQISGHVINVDNYGNLITNINKTDFDILSKNRRFNIHFGRETSGVVHQTYDQAEPGECFLLFNDLGLLEIGIYKGNASELLGLAFDSPVSIVFPEE
jgi:S-adenosyl-L-methionine hydrolase (adenosine-forming)